jgi:hypothetical protein
MVATDALLLVHTPPVVASVRVAIPDRHMLDEPEMAATEGSAFTVSVVLTVVAQPALVTM